MFCIIFRIYTFKFKWKPKFIVVEWSKMTCRVSVGYLFSFSIIFSLIEMMQGLPCSSSLISCWPLCDTPSGCYVTALVDSHVELRHLSISIASTPLSFIRNSDFRGKPPICCQRLCCKRSRDALFLFTHHLLCLATRSEGQCDELWIT